MKTLEISPTTYETLPLGILIPNSWNPNVMNEKDFNILKEHIDKSGGNFEQPILARKVGDKYEIVDGYHRFKALSELDFDEAYVRVEELSDKDARLKTIQMNKFRGDFDTLKLAAVIRELKENYSLTNNDLKAQLGYEPEEIFSLESFLDFNADDFIRLKEVKVDEEEETKVEEEKPGIIIELTQEEVDEINAFVAKTGLTTEQAIFSAIAMVRDDFLKKEEA